jgi:uncharacterized protein
MNPSITPPTLQQRLAERTRPDGPVVMHQRWEHLLFLHWRWDADTVQATLPPGLYVDTFEHAAWLGVVPLFMRDVRPPLVPSAPVVSDFLELNVRTYVHDELGRPGLYFYSLDCNQPLAVEAARRLMHLRYEHATMRATVDAEGVVDFESTRRGTNEPARFRYQVVGPPEPDAAPESLEFFLLERSRLFASDAAGEQLNTVQVGHPPYLPRLPLVLEWSPIPLRLAGFEVEDRAPDHFRAAEPQEVRVFAPEKV